MCEHCQPDKCRICSQTKIKYPLTCEYWQWNKQKNDFEKYCKPYKNSRRRELYNKDENYRLKILEDVKLNWSNLTIEEKLNRSLKYTFGITYQDKQNIFEKQNGMCPISNIKFQNILEACVDHCHETKQVRGLLDRFINLGLGCFQDNSTIIQQTIYYLQNTELQNKIQEIIESNKHKYWNIDSNWNSYEIKKNSDIRLRYGITLYDFDDIFNLQGNKCALSLKLINNKYDLCVDHCHETKQVRGLLLQRYNSGIGYFKENTQWLNNAIKYLNLFSFKTPPSNEPWMTY